MTTITSQRLKQRESASKWNYRVTARQKVIQRWEASGNRCEGCGLVVDIIEVAHLFSRGGHIIPDKYASTPELMAALCCAKTWGNRIGCHETIDRNVDIELRDRLRWMAVWRFAAKHLLLFEMKPGDSPLEGIRRMVDEVEGRA